MEGCLKRGCFTSIFVIAVFALITGASLNSLKSLTEKDEEANAALALIVGGLFFFTIGGFGFGLHQQAPRLASTSQADPVEQPARLTRLQPGTSRRDPDTYQSEEDPDVWADNIAAHYEQRANQQEQARKRKADDINKPDRWGMHPYGNL